MRSAMWNWALVCVVLTRGAAATATETLPSAPAESFPSAPPSPPPVATTPVAPTDGATWPMLRNNRPQYDRLPGYGWTVFGVDAANVTLHVGLYVATRDTSTLKWSLPYSFAALYLLSGPIIHGAHGRWGHAAGSLGLRLGLPLVLGLAGSWLLTGPPCTEQEKLQDNCDTTAMRGVGQIFGRIVGVGAAMVLDAALLARGDRVLRNPQSTPVSFAPWLDPIRQIAGVQWSGQL